MGMGTAQSPSRPSTDPSMRRGSWARPGAGAGVGAAAGEDDGDDGDLDDATTDMTDTTETSQGSLTSVD